MDEKTPLMGETAPTWPEYEVDKLPHHMVREGDGLAWVHNEAAKQKALIVSTTDRAGSRVDVFIPYRGELEPARMRQLISDAFIESQLKALPEVERNQEGVVARLHARYGLPGTHS